MNDRSYIGIDSTEHNEWIVVLWTEGKITLSRPFQNTRTELGALVQFITDHCSRPKICLKPTHPATFVLIKHLGEIPDVEVMLMSEVGFKMYQTWLLRAIATPLIQKDSSQAYLLACCAERMV
jgi:hypothetical protein